MEDVGEQAKWPTITTGARETSPRTRWRRGQQQARGDARGEEKLRDQQMQADPWVERKRSKGERRSWDTPPQKQWQSGQRQANSQVVAQEGEDEEEWATRPEQQEALRAQKEESELPKPRQQGRQAQKGKECAEKGEVAGVRSTTVDQGNRQVEEKCE